MSGGWRRSRRRGRWFGPTGCRARRLPLTFPNWVIDASPTTYGHPARDATGKKTMLAPRMPKPYSAGASSQTHYGVGVITSNVKAAPARGKLPPSATTRPAFRPRRRDPNRPTKWPSPCSSPGHERRPCEGDRYAAWPAFLVYDPIPATKKQNILGREIHHAKTLGIVGPPYGICTPGRSARPHTRNEAFRHEQSSNQLSVTARARVLSRAPRGFTNTRLPRAGLAEYGLRAS